MRHVVGSILGLVLLTASAPAGTPGAAPAGTPGAAPAAFPAVLRARPVIVRYAAPLAARPLRVLHGFSMPAGPYGPGHRGVDLAAPDGAVVVAAADGRVTFVGVVAGRGVVVVAHADGVRTEYEPVRASVRRGAVVPRGGELGRVAGRHGSCAPAGCLHWGARRGAGRAGYLDPLSLLRPLGPVRLLPLP